MCSGQRRRHAGDCKAQSARGSLLAPLFCRAWREPDYSERKHSSEPLCQLLGQMSAHCNTTTQFDYTKWATNSRRELVTPSSLRRLSIKILSPLRILLNFQHEPI